MPYDFMNITQWGVQLTPQQRVLIAGPCSAETEEQVLSTAYALPKEQVAFLRAGVWKPRTRPGTFEGAGEKAFDWLNHAKAETGFPFAVEVANAKHVEIALSHGVDAIWIGARTTVTPFAVQEIADALHGVDIPVFVKNPVNPDVELWIGAIERIVHAGISRIAAILRGCSGLAAGKYRNAPAWNLAIDLKNRLPSLPCLCDPSHIAGDKTFIQEIAQQAVNLDFQGLMIETHINPPSALSDSRQQLTPDELRRLLQTLVPRAQTSENPEGQRKLDELRLAIDQLDVTLLTTLASRMRVSREIGNLKRDNSITVLQTSRWEKVLAKAVEHGRQLGLEEDFVTDIFNRIHLESIAQQQ
ncbi:MAG: bifunctional 3-deoxy-7-phosphoheptulonate synthase/chorismate mutase type II [Victivallales bacterium]|nr:bifunctional 3-deoxy-7-phosphoheptulonate synthase/chorismate mutase type II [Victivallales bacterium]